MIILGLRSNLAQRYGGRRLTILRALEKLETKGVGIEKSSPFYETATSTIRRGPTFVTMVASVSTQQSAKELLTTCAGVEAELGRTRSTRNGARIIDINLLAFHDDILDDRDIQIPHPDLKTQGFFLYPIHDIDARWVDPLSKKTISQMIERIPTRQFVQRM